MLGNNKVDNSQVIEIKTIDFSLINSDNNTETEKTKDENDNFIKNENDNLKLIDLKNKVEVLEKKLLDKIKNDNLKLIDLENNIKVNLDELSSEIVKNSNQLKESNLIKNIIEESFRTIIKSNITENSENSENIKNNILENDLAIREIKLQLDSLTVNLKQTVNNEINKQIQVAFDSLFNNLFNQ